MIDTIIFKIHNLQKKYPQLYEQLYAPSRKKNTVLEAVADEDTGEILKNSFLHSYVFHDTNRVLPVSYRSVLPNNSYHYSVSFRVNSTEDFAEFNFSVPKYLYGQNVQQFISLAEQSSRVTYSLLLKFLVDFFDQNFSLQRPDFSDIEISRIDLCYNQFFNSKEDALLYLDYQKKLHQTKAKSDKNRCRTYGTSIMYTTRRYSFKIYHKGTEFEKHDKRAIVKEKNKRNLDLEYFQRQADCILRYEMTFRNSQINYLFERYFYSGKKHAANVNFASDSYAIRLRRFTKLTKQNNVETFIGYSKKFFLHSSWDNPDYCDTVMLTEPVLSFNFSIFNILYLEFWERVREYQIKNDLDINAIVSRINNYNGDVELKNKLRADPQKQVQNFRLLSTALLVQSGFDIAEFKQYLPKTSYYRLLDDLKKIGLSTRSAALNIPSPALDYVEYKIYFLKYH
ncbi:phage/plasmid replication domain-containing protein [Arachidicoccus terrestris]|uniref:phage/plasmid replication domain-containing protein n=1 Tax=Arachidicoccus terrestris TaxID=2875539 RepID=UPI001CC71FA5|nr:phage/plasmid replication protein [Arachidicoccus terrestris]UAY54787.1 hypothetical protein K9M52_15265 [Arachidicoccus terrestris]